MKRPIDNAREFIAALGDEELSDDELIARSAQFFEENVPGRDAEFAATLLQRKADGGGEAALGVIEEYAGRGAPAAQLALGAMMLTGTKMDKKEHEALFWLKRAYNGNSPKAGILLAAAYSGNSSLAVNMEKARAYMRGAADLGVPKAQYLYACMLLEGEGGPVDEETAIVYMLDAGRAQQEEALEFLSDNDLLGEL
ncbi:MAG: hypothetical protein AAGH76_08965 [Pseudomonadota bacterium]